MIAIGGGGAALPLAVAQSLLELYGLRYVEGYGLTETAAPSHSNPPDRPKQQCLGIPFVGVDARVINPDTLQEVAVGEQGEIIMRGPQIFDGYWQRPDATEAAFMEFDGDRYFRSGDLGHVDDEGYFFITDRLKRMINASGFKVWPAEVEALMFRLRGVSARQLPRRNCQGVCGVAPIPCRTSQRTRHSGLVPREHGGLQSA